ncbi:hypothetical protein G6F70_002764 [Rhizopus microsporus]|uniref:OPT family small oligopeptide transporter n=2 Tax=Rhizopus TaxID=4842 RepID=A0A367KC40_RHIAZ|nr:hypothetical protein G6F71_002723 [Rhizopus microsporus]RCH99775.1 hypothetical protein CU097_015474 [Rhizopus azygosporus]KAG1201856.1 hypothetical protein G6F70_002764 [Rhizopus microsporus]KAG1213803.1 hypothetical protein G6F69_002513 [Rhizopus microsporus]KAG1236094.1 hypothetical protein G6F67_002272 [Rhizopus microsporus]
MSFQDGFNKEETAYSRNKKEDDEKSLKNKDLWLSNPKDIKTDDESGPSEEEHYFDSDETDVAIVNDIAVINDNPDLPVLTVRSIITGLILSILSSSVSQLMQFKPVGSTLTNTFLLIVAYLICSAWAKWLPQHAWLNPGPFNYKEHTCIYIMVSSANTSAYGTLVLSTQQLFYSNTPGPAGSIFFLLATQLVGYGIAGQLRPFLVYPSNLIWPTSLPLVSVLSTFSAKSEEARWRTRFFFIVFFAIFVYELIPQYMFPLLGGLSIVCIARQDSRWVKNLFGGLNPNEGLGMFSLCFDWNLLSSISPLVLPFWVQMNILAGILLLWFIGPLAYYFNVWNAQSFPFLSNSIFRLFPNGTAEYYPQGEVLNSDNTVNQTALAEVGIPVYSTIYAISYVVVNMTLTATISHVFLFYGKQIYDTFRILRTKLSTGDLDIHMKLMKNYPEVPQWWYYGVFMTGIAVNIGVAYANHSGFPWWGCILAIGLSAILSLPLNMITAITGGGIGLNVFAEMIGGFVLPGHPIANMYFKTLGYNTLSQAGAMASDLKIGHYMKVPPRMTFLYQMLGTTIGAIFNYIINKLIVESKADVLLLPNGNQFWNGAGPQTMNSAAMTWGGIGPMAMFGPHSRYSMVLWAFFIGFLLPVPFWALHKKYPKAGFQYVNIPMIASGYMIMPGSTTSWITCSYIIVIYSQFYLKRRYTAWFAKHNYLISAALDSGTSIMVFLLSMTVQGGGSGVPYPFPTWWGNRQDLAEAGLYPDMCCAKCSS